MFFYHVFILTLYPLIHANSSLFVGIVSKTKTDRNYKTLLESFTSYNYNITVDKLNAEGYLETLEFLSKRFEEHDHALLMVEEEYTFNSVLSCEVLVATCEYYNVPVVSSFSETLCFKQKDIKKRITAQSQWMLHTGVEWMTIVHGGSQQDSFIIEAFKNGGRIKVDYILNVNKNLTYSPSSSPLLTNLSSILKHICAQSEQRIVYLTDDLKAFEDVFVEWKEIDYGSCIVVLSDGVERYKNKPTQFVQFFYSINNENYIQKRKKYADNKDKSDVVNALNDKDKYNKKNRRILNNHTSRDYYNMKSNEETFLHSISHAMKCFKKVAKKNKKTNAKICYRRLKRLISENLHNLYTYEIKEIHFGEVVKEGLISRQEGKLIVEWDGRRENLKSSVKQSSNSYNIPFKVLATADSILLIVSDYPFSHFENKNKFNVSDTGVKNRMILMKEKEDLERDKMDMADGIRQRECDPGRVPCFDYINDHMHCCHGYVVDLLEQLALKLNFTFKLFVLQTTNYSYIERVKKESLIGGVMDMVFGVVDVGGGWMRGVKLTAPYMLKEISVVVKKDEKGFSMTSFLQPFRHSLWMMVAVSVHVVALVLYLLDRFSPFGRFKLERSQDTEEDALNLSSAMWFAWGVLLNSGIGEGTPRSFSARVCGLAWAGFAMIIVASYTANLAAFLVRDRSAGKAGSDHELWMQSGSIEGSDVMEYFRNRLPLRRVYQSMLSNQYTSVNEAVQAVRLGKLEAFVWDWKEIQTYLKSCDIRVLSESVAKVSEGIGVRKESRWSRSVSEAIEAMHEDGLLDRLESMWLTGTSVCDETSTSAATLQLYNMAGVFVMVAWGIVAGVLILLIEMAYHKHQENKLKKMEAVKNIADRWKSHKQIRTHVKDPLKIFQN